MSDPQGTQPQFDYREFKLRKSLYNQADSVSWSLYYTYKRMYVAAEWVGRFGWILDVFIVIIGSVLLYILTRESAPDFLLFRPFTGFSPTDLALLILVSSLLSTFYGPKLRSRDYYNAGQELQELQDEVVYFRDHKLVDPQISINELESEFQQLQRRRHRLNQSTPQLGGHWYKLMKGWNKIIGFKNIALNKIFGESENNSTEDSFEDILYEAK